MTLHRGVGWVRFPHSPAILLLLALTIASPRAGRAQQRDSARAGVTQPKQSIDTPKPPLSPRRAFLSSLLLPGYAQTVFGRSKAAMLFAAIEVGSIGMARKSAMDLQEAKTMRGDSVVATYKVDPQTGRAEVDPKTGLPIPDTYIASRFTDDRVKARRTHYEDWIAAIIFNHLFSGADAYVAANLWDFRTNIGAVAHSRGVGVYATVSWR